MNAVKKNFIICNNYCPVGRTVSYVRLQHTADLYFSLCQPSTWNIILALLMTVVFRVNIHHNKLEYYCITTLCLKKVVQQTHGDNYATS